MARITSLLVAPSWASPPHTGAGQRTHMYFETLKNLGDTHVAVLSGDGSGNAAFYGGCASFSAVESQPFAIPTRKNSGLRKRISRILTRTFAPDRLLRPCPQTRSAVHGLVEATGADVVVFRYAKALCAADPANTPSKTRAIFLDWDDRDDQQYLSALEARAGRRVARSPIARRAARNIERRVRDACAATDRIWVTDRRALSDPPDPREGVVENTPAATVPQDDLVPASTGTGLLFVGSIGFRPNQEAVHWFLQNVWPVLSREDPEIRIRLVGGGDWSRFRDLHGSDRRIEIIGFADSLAEHYRQARATIAPIFSGGGTQIKVIESCMFARPVVTSSFASDGYDREMRSNFLVADTPADFAEACLLLLRSPEAADARGSALRLACEAKYSREAVSQKVKDEILRELNRL